LQSSFRAVGRYSAKSLELDRQLTARTIKVT
jgi:hypothetical protein